MLVPHVGNKLLIFPNPGGVHVSDSDQKFLDSLDLFVDSNLEFFEGFNHAVAFSCFLWLLLIAVV